MYTSNNSVRLIEGGKAYFETLLALIEGATNTIHIQTYIFAEDETGVKIAEALKAASRRGIEVFLMVDGYASQQLSKRFIDELRATGIQFRFFEPLFRARRFYLGRRLHHKIALADLAVGLVGGINIANHYNDLPGKPAWLDFALRVKGEIVPELFVLCQKTWNGFQVLKKAIPFPEGPTLLLPKEEQKKIRVSRNDWVRRKFDIAVSYQEMFSTAKEEIIILSSYFLPGKLFRNGIREARARGVQITIIVAALSDVRVAKMAERYMYEWLLSLGVRIFEYNRTVLHGKLAICDNRWITLGSFNVNDISTYASVELNLDVADIPFATTLRDHIFEYIIPDCTLISNRDVVKQSWLIRVAQRLSFGFVRMIFHFFTFYFKQIKEDESVKKLL